MHVVNDLLKELLAYNGIYIHVLIMLMHMHIMAMLFLHMEILTTSTGFSNCFFFST